jgi:hypothetical protein
MLVDGFTVPEVQWMDPEIASKHCRAAGVVLYYVDRDTRQRWVVLGMEKRGPLPGCDDSGVGSPQYFHPMGGRVDAEKDRGDIRRTAVRECVEESAGLFPQAELEAKVQAVEKCLVHKSYALFFVEYDAAWPLTKIDEFNVRRSAIGGEKVYLPGRRRGPIPHDEELSALAWVSMEEVLSWARETPKLEKGPAIYISEEFTHLVLPNGSEWLNRCLYGKYLARNEGKDVVVTRFTLGLLTNTLVLSWWQVTY